MSAVTSQQLSYLLVIGLVPVGVALLLVIVTRLESSLAPNRGSAKPQADAGPAGILI